MQSLLSAERQVCNQRQCHLHRHPNCRCKPPTCEAGQQRREQRGGLDQEAGPRSGGQLQAHSLLERAAGAKGNKGVFTFRNALGKP